MSPNEQNIAGVRACFENAARGTYEQLESVLDDEFVLHNPEDHHGVEGLAAMVEGYRSAIPDLELTIDHQFGAADYVASRFTVRGTHRGDLMGVPATGREVAFTGITISRCRDGKIVEEWELADTLGLLGQVGGLPEPARS